MSVVSNRAVRALVVALAFACLGVVPSATATATTTAAPTPRTASDAPSPITGVVLTPGGEPAAGVGVMLWSPSAGCSICSPSPISSAGVETGANGRFTLTPPEFAHDMRVSFHPPAGGRYHQSFYPGAWFVSDADVLDGGEDLTMTLPVGGTVAGTITTQGDVPSTRIRLRSTEEDAEGRLVTWTSQTRYEVAGSYVAGAVPPGTYAVQFCVDDHSGNGDYTSWCPSGNVVSPTSGDATVTADHQTVGKDVTLVGATPAVLNTALPTISPTGTPRVGTTLSTTGGSWSPSGVSRTYQWLAEGASISGATSPTYTVPATMAGKRLSVRVRASAPDHTATTRTSALTAAVAPGTLTQRTAPLVTGPLQVGQRLTASPGTWSPSPARTTYQWIAGTARISGATTHRLVLTRAMRGKRISVRVTVSRPGYTTRSVTAARGTLR